MADPPQTQAMTTAGLNLIQQALTIYDRDLRLAVCNRRFREMFDLPENLVTPGAGFEDTIRYLAERGEYGEITDIPAFVAERVEIARAFEPHYMERTRANGRTISVEGSPLPEGGWVTVYTDITDVKSQEMLLRARSEELSDQLLSRAEELAATNRNLAATITALEETKRQLIETEARTRHTTEMMPAHIAHVGSDGRYTFSNRRLTSVMPGRPEDIVGRPIREVLGPQAFARVEPHLAAALEEGRSPVFEFTDDASARRIRVSFTPDGQGGVYILSMDVTEETQARVALQQVNRRTLGAQMISGLAHDFSNLLTIVLGLQGRLSRIEGLSDEARDLIDGTLAATHRGGELLRRIGNMTASRTYRAEATDLSRLLSDLEILARPTLPQGVELAVYDTLPPGRVMIDPDMAQDGLLNLILNARDACGQSGRITISAALVHDTWIDLTVSDSGPGFSPRALEHAFEPFFTTKGREGSGLGLPMVWDMAKLAGGDLRLRNGGTGARVTLRLPYRPAPVLKGGLVLLVEDDDFLRSDIRRMLTELGHAVIEAESADEATALSADIPDIELVLSDLRISGEATGVDLADRLAGTGLPILLMTSLPADDPLHVAARARAPVLCKPFRRADLARALAPQAAA